MHFFPLAQATWPLLACAGVAQVASAESGVVEIDLVFPRNNQTFAPTSRFPIVFGYQHPELASTLLTNIEISVWNEDKEEGAVLDTYHDMRWANFTSRDPYLNSAYYKDIFNTEGHWYLKWSVTWDSCTKESLGVTTYRDHRIMTNTTGGAIYFTTSSSAPEMDLVAATDNKDCSKDMGVAIDVTETLDVPSWVDWRGGETCASVASSTRAPEPCRVKIDPSAASSMAASMTAQACYMEIPGPEDIDCPLPEEKSIAYQLAVGGTASLAAAIGVIGYLVTV